MIIPFGASIWRSGRSSLSASQIGFETAPARTANSRYGRRRAATRASPSSVKSRSGVPPSASTPKTADQPEQDSYKRRPPVGNRTSTETLPCAAPPWRRCRETSDWWTVSRSPARRSTSHASNTRCSSRCPARAPLVSASVNSKDLCDERYRPGPEQLARLTIPTCVQDRLRFSEALRLGDNSHRNRAAVIHKLPQHKLGVGPLLDRRPWAHEHRWTATRPRPRSDAIGGKA
jgi:hypothetical protein